MHNPIEQAEHTVAGWFHPDTKETDMTVTAPEQATPEQTAAAAAAQTPASFWTNLHRNLTIFTGTMSRFLPHLEQIATNPALDAAVEALLEAAGAGVEAEVFQFVTGALRSAAAQKTAPVTAPADGTGTPAAQSGTV